MKSRLTRAWDISGSSCPMVCGSRGGQNVAQNGVKDALLEVKTDYSSPRPGALSWLALTLGSRLSARMDVVAADSHEMGRGVRSQRNQAAGVWGTRRTLR